MIPEEKAKELVYDYINAPFNCKDCTEIFCNSTCTILTIEECKICALIVVNHILNIGCIDSQYWIEVEDEIKKIII